MRIGPIKSLKSSKYKIMYTCKWTLLFEVGSKVLELEKMC
jgi:hypothetical protein